EDLPQVPLQVADVVADAAHAELAEIGEVLADLRRVQVELLRQRLRGNGLDARVLELVEAAKVHRQPVRREFGNLLEGLPRLRLPGQGFDPRFHKAGPIVPKAPMLISPAMATAVPPPAQPGTRSAFQPYVPATQSPAEFTAKAIIIGAL